MPIPTNEYNSIVPGSRIPDWFSHQNIGYSVNIELPPHWYNTKLMGLAYCVVLNLKRAAIHSYNSGMMIKEPSYFGLPCYLNNDYYVHTDLDSLYIAPERAKSFESDHMLFGYKSLSVIDIVVASFELIGSNGKVKKYGVHLVYEEDEKDSGCTFPFGTM